ncbi:MAG: SprT-like domain-containing protein [Rhodopila sp.]
MNAINPTQRTYKTLDDAYRFFNERLFKGRLPGCLITMQRKKGTKGYFSSEKFSLADNSSVTDEIALNPATFRDCTAEDILSTLVHEMAHLEQHHFGKPARGRYHNEEWAQLMMRVGLVPSDTGLPGGKQVGQRVTHYIDPAGPFAAACAELLTTGFDPLYGDAVTDTAAQKKKAQSKTKYTCPQCSLNCWAKPDAGLGCIECRAAMQVEGSEGKIITWDASSASGLDERMPDIVAAYRVGARQRTENGVGRELRPGITLEQVFERQLSWCDIIEMISDGGYRDASSAISQARADAKKKALDAKKPKSRR